MNLVDLISQKSQDMGVQIKKAVPMTQDEVVWAKKKVEVDQLTSSEAVMESMIADAVRGGKAKQSALGKCNQEKCQEALHRVEIPVTEKDFKVDMITYVCRNHGVKTQSYVAYNVPKSVAYQRYIRKNYEAII